MTDEEILKSRQKLGVIHSSLDDAIDGTTIETPIKFENEHVPQPKSKLQLDQDAVDNLMSNDFGFLTGEAGTGKSTLITEVCRINPHEFELCATTGIAGINLGTKTLHSTLKFFDTRSLGLAFDRGLLHMNLRKVRARKKKLFIDEVSMLGAEPFDLLMNAIDEINSDKTANKLGLWVSGDMAQLPPIKERYVFRGDYWNPRFSDNTIKLTKVWRQTNKDFLDGINLIRKGAGVEAMKFLQKAGVNFTNQIDDHFDGTTLIAKNDGVDVYNTKRLNELTTPLIRVTVITSGVQHNEWQRLIPFELRLKTGALVMILANDIPNFDFVNGDLGTIESYDADSEFFNIKLKRNDKVVRIKRIERLNLTDDEPNSTGRFQPYHDYQSGQWVSGWIRYFPLRLAWASTIHKSQGLSLDKVQIDTRGQFFGYDSMGYVSISRARTPEGLYLVGTPTAIGQKVRMSKEVANYV